MKNKSKMLFIAVPVMLILLGAVLYQYAYLPVRSELNDLEEAVSGKAKTLAKYKSVIAQKPRIEERLAALIAARKAERSKTIESQTPSIAAASLQDMVKGMITARGGTIASERAEKPEDMGKFKIITVTIDAVLPDTRALADAIYAIENQSPYLVIRELDTRIKTFKDPRDLTVKLKVSALMEGR
jgi:hypothetical protein